MSQLDTTAKLLQSLYEERSDVLTDIADLKARATKINDAILHLIPKMWNIEPLIIHTTSDHDSDFKNGSRCWVCGKSANLHCYTCKQDNKLYGYCYNHRDKHIESATHPPIYYKVRELLTDKIKEPKESKPSLTPEQELAELERLQKELTDQIEAKKKELEQ